jgi:hypothetical protein
VALFLLVPLPLLSAAWLAAAASAGSLARGLLISGAWGLAVIGLAELVGRALRGAGSRWLGCAALEVGLAALVLGFRDLWVGWTGL